MKWALLKVKGFFQTIKKYLLLSSILCFKINNNFCTIFSVREMYENASGIEGARSLETVNNIAQFALEAMEKYEKLNE